MPAHGVLIQCAGVARGRDAVLKHSRAVFKLEKSVEHWVGEVAKGLEGDAGEKAAKGLFRAEQRLTKLQDRGDRRLFRSRKQEDTSNLRSLVVDGGARIDDGVLVIPGGIRVLLSQSWNQRVPDGGEHRISSYLCVSLGV